MAQNIVDTIALGGIVTVRDRLLAMQAEGKPVMRLESGDPSFEIPPHVREAIEKALKDGHTHYTSGIGIPAFRKAAYKKLREENGLPVVDPNHVLVINGAMHGLYITFKAILNPGDEVIVPDPTWTETADNVTLAHGTPVRCRLDPSQGYRYDPGAIEAAVTERTRAIAVNTPHNPTGVVLDQKTLEGILDVAQRHDLFVVSDEAYEHVIYDGLKHVSIGSLPGGENRVVSIYSLSKSYAMSGLRLGYLTVNDDLLVERMTKLLRCTVNGINSATQHGGVAALTGPQDATREMCREYQTRRDILIDGLSKLQFLEPLRPSGAFYIWSRINENWTGYKNKRDGWAMTHYFIDTAGIGSSPGEVFGQSGSGHIRFAYSCPTDHVKRAVEILTKRIV